MSERRPDPGHPKPSEVDELRAQIDRLRAELAHTEARLAEERMKGGERGRIIALIQRLDRDILSARDRAAIYRSAVESLAGHAGFFDRAVVFAKPVDSYEPVAQHGYQEADATAQLTAPFFAEEVERTGHLLYNGATEDRFQARSFIAVHFSVELHERIDHILFVGNQTESAARRPELTRLDVETLEFLAGQIRVAIENRRALEVHEAKLAVDAANRAKSDFLTHMSHEIRTPMNGILGMTSLLLDMPLELESHHHVTAIHECAEWLLCVLNDILDFSKVEAGTLELEIVDFQIRDTVAGALSLFKRTAREKGLVLASAVAEDVPDKVRGDPARLRQILLNLVNNAIKFTPSGRIDVRVTATATVPEPVIRFEVEDTGVGIPEARRHRLFQSFSQGDASTNREHGGTGLGLAISKGLVQAMGGRIGVESVEDQGSCFWFEIELPTVVATRSATPDIEPGSGLFSLPAKMAARDAYLPASGASIRVLLVEDNPINQKVAVTMLVRMGFDVDAVGNGRDAVSVLSEGLYDVVLMDVQMPIMDGLEATRVIRDPASAVRDHQVPIIALTAHAMKDDRERCERAGMNDYVSKPLKPKLLYTLIHRHVESHRNPLSTEQS